jgi:MFS family permease
MPLWDRAKKRRRENRSEVVASPPVVESSSRLGLLRRSPSFGYLFLATAGSSFGTYLAAVALTVSVYDATGSGTWVAALLIADFLPIVLIGLLLGPLIDRLSRRRLMIASDLVRCGVFAALPFVDQPAAIVALAGVSGIATGFFHPAANAGLPNLVDDDDLTNANSLLQTVETLAMMAGPVLAGLMLTVWPPSVPYAVNAVTFLVSAALVARIADRELRSDEPVTQGHWRDVADGIRLVLTSRPLRTVLVVWNVVVIGSAAVNVAEVVFAKKDLDAGNVGFGALVAASGIGLALGSFLAAPALGKVGLRRHYVGSIALMGVGWGAAALSGSIWLAIPFVIGGAAGNGAAGVCNRLLVQRGAPDQYRGRALATIMSSNYAIVGLAMAAAGVLTDVFGARAVWLAAGIVYLVGALVALVMTRWLPVRTEEERQAFEESLESAVAGLATRNGRVSVPEPEFQPDTGLERIARLMEEIEARRAVEARRSS